MEDFIEIVHEAMSALERADRISGYPNNRRIISNLKKQVLTCKVLQVKPVVVVDFTPEGWQKSVDALGTLRKAAEQALESLERCLNPVWEKRDSGWFTDMTHASNAIASLHQALNEQAEAVPHQEEPFAWMSVGGSIWRHKTREDDVPLYTRPPKTETAPEFKE